MATPDPQPTERGQGWNLQPHGFSSGSVPLSHDGKSQGEQIFKGPGMLNGVTTPQGESHAPVLLPRFPVGSSCAAPRPHQGGVIPPPWGLHRFGSSSAQRHRSSIASCTAGSQRGLGDTAVKGGQSGARMGWPMAFHLESSRPRTKCTCRGFLVWLSGNEPDS